MSIFEQLNRINVNGHTEKKNGLTYLSWAWAWAEVKKLYPEAMYTIYERETEYGPVNYFTDGRTCWVKTGVTIEGLEYIEELPVMDFKNRSIAYDTVTSMDINKAIQRSLTKACARHGLGLYIYAGEDLPEEEMANIDPVVLCVSCHQPIEDWTNKNGKRFTKMEILARAKERFGSCMCYKCCTEAMRNDSPAYIDYDPRAVQEVVV